MVDGLLHDGFTRGPAENSTCCGDDERCGENDEIGPAAEYRDQCEHRRADDRPEVSRGRTPPGGRSHCGARSPGVGVGTVASTSSITVAPEASVSHSSGLTVTR